LTYDTIIYKHNSFNYNMTPQIEIQLGKKGLTPEFLEGLKKRFERTEVKNIKIKVLANARENREDVKGYAEEIIKYLGKKFNYRVIGFTIFVKKFRKEQR
jgi:RNA-binding protein YhbY